MTRQEAITEIKETAPQLLADYRALALALGERYGFAVKARDAADEDDDREEIDPDELQELYEAVAEFAEGYDLDSIDRLLRQAKDYKIPEAERERFAKLEACARESDWDGIKELFAS